MKKTLLTDKPIAFFGDIHGHWNFVEKIPYLLPNHYYVFVGDYVDSFTRSTIEQIRCLTQVLDWVKEGHATALYGNHENSYWVAGQLASGFTNATAAHMMPLKSEGQRLLLPSLLIDNVLVTHAGLTRPLHEELRSLYPTEDLDDVILDLSRFTTSPLWRIGQCRGGYSEYGGIWWCDWANEFDPVPGLHQVFGHSNSKYPPRHFTEETQGTLRLVRFADSRSYNIDSLGREGCYDILCYDNYKFSYERFYIES